MLRRNKLTHEELMQIPRCDDRTIVNERGKVGYVYRAFAREMLFRAHSLWVETNGAKGERLDLSGLDMRRVNLSGAIMDEADLTDARLWGADLSRSDQRGSTADAVKTGPAPKRWREMSRRVLSADRKSVLNRPLGGG